jgi:hypothetical protein
MSASNFIQEVVQTHYYGKVSNPPNSCPDKNKCYCTDANDDDCHPTTEFPCDAGHCSLWTEKGECGSNQMYWDNMSCAGGFCTGQDICSYANIQDCPTYSKAKASSVTIKNPDKSDNIIKCKYNSYDFRDYNSVLEYVNQNGYDNTWMNIIMPDFAAQTADVNPLWDDLGTDKKGNDPAGKPIVSRFFSVSSDGDMCREWMNQVDGSKDGVLIAQLDTTMDNWCAKYPWVPECSCLQRAAPKPDGDEDYKALKLGIQGENDGCWYIPCVDTTRHLVHYKERHPSDCSGTCTNIVAIVDSENVDIGDLQQNMTCDITNNEGNGDDNGDNDNNGNDDGNDQDLTREERCSKIHFTKNDPIIYQSINMMGTSTSTHNQDLIEGKVNYYVNESCTDSQNFTPTQIDEWLSSAPYLYEYPIFNADGSFSGEYQKATQTQMDKAQKQFKTMTSATSFPCQSKYQIFLDPAKTITDYVYNDNYQECLGNQEARYSIPMSDGSCPYTRTEVDPITGKTVTQEVSFSSRDACMLNSSYIPGHDGSPPDENNNDDGNGDDDDNSTDQSWFEGLSNTTQNVIIGVTLGGAALLAMAGGFMLFKGFTAKDKVNPPTLMETAYQMGMLNVGGNIPTTQTLPLVITPTTTI